MTRNSGIRLRKLPESARLEQPQISPSDMPEAPVYILGKTPAIDELNRFLAQFGCQTNLSLLRPIKIWADLSADIINEADKVIQQFIPEDLKRDIIVIILPALVSLAAALVARIKDKCPALKVLIVHYRVEHEPRFIGFELFCG